MGIRKCIMVIKIKIERKSFNNINYNNEIIINNVSKK